MTESISIFIADDHNLFRAGLREIIKKEAKYFIVGEASNGNELIEKCKKLNPDVVISDLIMPEVDGISAISQLKSENPEMKSIIVSIEYNKATVYRAWKAGVNAMLGKDCDEGEFMYALSNVIKDEIYFSGIRNEEEITNLKTDLQPLRSENEKFNTYFTNKEKEILEHLEKGMSSEQIAEIMCIGKRTVDFYRAKLIQKLNFKNSNELVAFAVKYSIYHKYRNF